MKKNLILLILFAFSFNGLFSQQDSAFVKASFDGDIEKYFAKQIKYPRDLAARNIRGRTVLSFVISKLGELESVVIEEFPHIDLAKGAIAILKSTKGMWSPTIEDTVAIDFNYKIIINYQGHSSQPMPTKEKSLVLKDKALRKIKKEDYEKALALINDAIKINPFRSEYYDMRSRIHYSLNNTKDAELDKISAIKFNKEIVMIIDVVSYSVTRTTKTRSYKTVRRM